MKEDTSINTSLRAIQIGPITIQTPLLLAPMAGIADYPFREIARHQGAGLCVSEMLTSQIELWHSQKSSLRLPNAHDPEPRPIQIAGADPQMMAQAATQCEALGAGIIDINMGCPAKKVCNRAAGSALMAHEDQVALILDAVVNAVSVPVTLKMRTGPAPDNKNALRLALLAESLGVRALTIHGRTRACRFNGFAEYDTIAEVVQAVSIPVIANGDIDSPHKAAQVLKHTGVAGLMIGRAARGQPWIFQQIRQFLSGETVIYPTLAQVSAVIFQHLDLMAEHLPPGRRIGFIRKHINWYLDAWDTGRDFRKQFNQIDSEKAQRDALISFFQQKAQAT